MCANPVPALPAATAPGATRWSLWSPTVTRRPACPSSPPHATAARASTGTGTLSVTLSRYRQVKNLYSAFQIDVVKVVWVMFYVNNLCLFIWTAEYTRLLLDTNGNLWWMNLLHSQTHLKPGKYILGFRYDCEATAQVWSNCADVTLEAWLTSILSQWYTEIG